MRNRLKTSIDDKSLQDRLQHHPEIIEFYLDEHSLSNIALIRKKIRFVQDRGIRVYLHHPSSIRGKYLDIISDDPYVRDYYMESSKLLAQLCREEHVRCVIHCHYAQSRCSMEPTVENTVMLREEIERILEFGRDVFLWEDTTQGLFAHSNPHLLEHLIEPLQLDLTLDVSHSFIAVQGDNDKLFDIIKRTYPYVTYLHIVDSGGERHDGLELGSGRIDWNRLVPYIKGKDFIFEVKLADVYDCSPMVRSAHYFGKLLGEHK